MKRISLVAAILLLVTAISYAQNSGNRDTVVITGEDIVLDYELPSQVMQRCDGF